MILLVRHGETAGNAARVLQTPETPLSQVGLDQARRLARRLLRLEPAAIVSSDLVRARMTAQAVCDATGLPLALDPGLQERNFGDLRGTPYAELAVDPFAPDYVPPGGESWQDLHTRTDSVWERVLSLARRHAGPLVVVTHGLVCHSLVTRRLSLAPGTSPPRGFANTSLTEVEVEPPWRVGLLNCVAHLEPTGSEAGLEA